MAIKVLFYDREIKMKVIDDYKLFVGISKDVYQFADHLVKNIEMNCFRCGYPNKLTEIYINDRQLEKINLLINILERTVNDVNIAIEKIYGVDPRRELLNKEIAEIQKRFLKHLRIVK